MNETLLLQLRLGEFACIVSASVRFVQAITSTFMHGFQNNLALLFSLGSKRAICNIYSGRLNIKVRLESQMINCPGHSFDIYA